MPELPQKLFVRFNDDGLSLDDDDQFLRAGAEPGDISVENESPMAGVYELRKKVQIVNKTEVFDIEVG